MPLEIKDITGLSEPLKKLIEVISFGIGRAAEPLLIKKKADAQAYEIATIAKAIEENKYALSKIQISDGKVEVSHASAPESQIQQIEERIITRLSFQEVKRQSNIDSVVNHSATYIEEEQHVTDEPVDEDWITRFFRIAEDINNEQMQALWGRVLAGEVKAPGSYSLRCLDVLKNLSKNEADIFARLGKLALTAGNKELIVNVKGLLEKQYGFNFTDFLTLEEVGLLTEKSGLSYEIYQMNKSNNTIFLSNSNMILVKRGKEAPPITLPVLVFTSVGQELLKLIDRQIDDHYIDALINALKEKDTVISKAIFTGISGITYHFKNEQVLWEPTD